LLLEPNKNGIKVAHISGLWYGYSQGIRFIFIGIIFYIASIFINQHGDDPVDTYIGVYVLFMAAIGTGVSLSCVPSVGKAKQAASTIFEIIDEPSKIDTRVATG